MTFHHLELLRQPRPYRVRFQSPNRVQPEFMDTTRVIATRLRRGVPDVSVDRQLRILRIPAMRTVPRFVHPRLRQDGQALCAAAGGPKRECAAAEHRLRPTPRLALGFTPVLEIAGKKPAKRPRLGAHE